MPRTHYIVRLSKRALIPGRSLTFTRGDEVPASIIEIRTEDLGEAASLAQMPHDGCLETITKIHRKGRREIICNGYNNGGFASPEERERLDIGDILDFVARLAATGDKEARELLAKHDGSCIAKGA